MVSLALRRHAALDLGSPLIAGSDGVSTRQLGRSSRAPNPWLHFEQISMPPRTHPSIADILEPEGEDVDTYIFCRHPMNQYISPKSSWETFQSGAIGQLRFHANGLPPPALKTEVELFGERLDQYMLGLGYAGTVGARYAIRERVSAAGGPMQGLLDVMIANYVRIDR